MCIRDRYDITWKVLDSDTDGPLEWVKIGIPNSNVEEIEGYSSNIENIRYYNCLLYTSTFTRRFVCYYFYWL